MPWSRTFEESSVMLKIGIVGWRGMVGSVLMARMREERDFDHFEPVFFSTSQAGGAAPDVGKGASTLGDARSVDALKKLDAVITCQGGDYTNEVYPKLRAAGWNGYWIDAASALRMKSDAIIILDPVNMDVIKRSLSGGVKNFIGGNCTVSLMLIALHGLFRDDLVEWMTSMTYQAASGAGAEQMRELVAQMGAAHASVRQQLADPASAILEIDRTVAATLRSPDFPTKHFGHPLAGSVLPWIDKDMGDGQSREEWKGQAEGNKILGREANPVPIDGVCVRVGAMRCHSQALTLKLRRDLPIDEIRSRLAEANRWVEVVPNERDATLSRLTPAHVTGKLTVPIGRLRKMKLDASGTHLTAFTVGDQLLWGAAEPLRRMLRILIER
jgi:aspartate-semialdehyde dehydrogenase